MNKLRRRRCRNILIVIVLAILAIALDRLASLSLFRTTILSGWVLLCMVVGLALYNVRKKLDFLPLGSSTTWLQVHIYVGWLSFVIFVLHLHWRVPQGILEAMLATLYVFVFLSGVLGLVISRLFARRLTAQGDEVMFEQIPSLRKLIHREVEKLVLQCLSETESTAIPEFYTARLSRYFDGPRGFWGHLLHSNRAQQAILLELQWQRRYLNDTERQYMEQIAERVRAKNVLDYHHAHQATLKYWLFVHLPLSYALLAFAMVHVVLVYAFSGGVR